MTQYHDSTRRPSRVDPNTGSDEGDVYSAMARMSSLLAHEMFNPLAAALGQAELLSASLPEGGVKERVDVITSELERLKVLWQNLLDFVHSRRIQRDDHACAQLVRDLHASIRDERLRIDPTRQPVMWSFDSLLLHRALVNIIQNALSVSEPGSPVELTIELQGDELHLVVRDHGPGFQDSIDVFEPFTTTKFHGKGLGLTIASEIVHAHDGLIEIYNHHEGGAVVRIALPRTQSNEQLIEI